MTNRRMTILWLVIVAAVMVKAYPTTEQTDEPGVEVENNVEDEGTYKPETAVAYKTADGKILMPEYREILKPEYAETTTPEFMSQEYIYSEEDCPSPDGLCPR
ncbi:TrV2 [Tranosema rostrale ichnovirus]|nr:TrV2 precursor [Tranosema rostrale ichnovirus]BAF45631.1 TrV2 [Tranosema rostrale ichnovirus]